LTEPVNGSSVLFVDEEHSNILSDPFYISKIYPLAKQVYPDILSLHIASIAFHSLIENGTLIFDSIQVDL